MTVNSQAVKITITTRERPWARGPAPLGAAFHKTWCNSSARVLMPSQSPTSLRFPSQLCVHARAHGWARMCVFRSPVYTVRPQCILWSPACVCTVTSLILNSYNAAGSRAAQAVLEGHALLTHPHPWQPAFRAPLLKFSFRNAT